LSILGVVHFGEAFRELTREPARHRESTPMPAGHNFLDTLDIGGQVLGPSLELPGSDRFAT
jgi:hypothetical protein